MSYFCYTKSCLTSKLHCLCLQVHLTVYIAFCWQHSVRGRCLEGNRSCVFRRSRNVFPSDHNIKNLLDVSSPEEDSLSLVMSNLNRRFYLFFHSFSSPFLLSRGHEHEPIEHLKSSIWSFSKPLRGRGVNRPSDPAWCQWKGRECTCHSILHTALGFSGYPVRRKRY